MCAAMEPRNGPHDASRNGSAHNWVELWGRCQEARQLLRSCEPLVSGPAVDRPAEKQPEISSRASCLLSCPLHGFDASHCTRLGMKAFHSPGNMGALSLYAWEGSLWHLVSPHTMTAC